MTLEIKESIINEVKSILKSINCTEDVILEKPKNKEMGEYALPCFTYSKSLRKSPVEIATYIKENMDEKNYEKIEVVNGYVNIHLHRLKTTKNILSEILTKKEKYGASSIGSNKTVVMDYSAPNISKPFGIGQFRTTVIGNSLNKIYKFLGYKVIAINHLGDYGTQFGKLIFAYKTWGNKEIIEKNPIEELKNLYVKFHDEAQKDPKLDDAARAWFKRLEDGDKEALELWEWFREESMKEFEKTYDLLGIEKFDSYNGESFYTDKMAAVVDELTQKKLLVKDDGALVVKIGDDMPPALIKRSDGASLYITRDLAAILYRKKEYNFDEMLYVVGNDQILHFKQLFKVTELMGYDWHKQLRHINFGMVLLDGKKMATRKGHVTKLEDVLNDAIDLSKKYLLEHKSGLKNIDAISKKIGVGAVIYNDLKNYRTNDIDFDIEDVLKFEGETGPYIEYTNVRIKSLLKNISNNDIHYNEEFITEEIWNMVVKMMDFNETLLRAKSYNDPSVIAKYVYDLTVLFNKFYATEKILDENELKKAFKLNVSYAVSNTIEICLNLLGLEILEEM